MSTHVVDFDMTYSELVRSMTSKSTDGALCLDSTKLDSNTAAVPLVTAGCMCSVAKALIL